ncbi:MAG TPA: hypothetical protein PK825_02630 [Bacteroidales bacterium]|nr:hypothetical protein [Bacteroidales bacterium]
MKQSVAAVCGILFIFLFARPADSQQTSNWFPFHGEDDFSPSEIDMSHWLDKPAGKHGFVLMDKDRFLFEDGTPVKFWGTNIASELPFMSSKEAETWVKFLSKYGFNAVRFHKFTWEATDGFNSTVIVPSAWEKFDYLCNALRKAGIYYGWSHIYGHRVLPGDSSRLLAYNEIASTRFPWSHLNGTTSALVNFAEDLQNLNIELTVNMLNHVNPYTGLRYAMDPALNFIELQNEDNIFWAAIEESLKQAPTYRKLLCRKFSQWLKEKYGSQENLLKAWNNEGLGDGETLDRQNIYPQPNHGLFSWEYEQAIKENRPVKQHILDKAEFLYREQVKFYQRFVEAIRNTGYRGPIVGSCWQAGTGLTHLLNLHADYLTGYIDRHNYFGGGEGHTLKPGKFSNASMISSIGSGLFGTGLQQVSNRPFALSEWMSLIPNEWTAESAPIIAVYGMGLQGWDASYVFATDFPHYTTTIQAPWGGIYNATSPTQLALYPALVNMICRRDVAEGETVVNRHVYLPDVLKGNTSFRETVVQDWDRKKIEGNFPLQAMAAGKVMITFTDKPAPDNIVDLTQYIHSREVYSTTRQLMWSEQGRGYFTVNTPGTKALVGFAPKKSVQLGEVSLQTSNEFAVIFLSSLDPGKDIAHASRLLLTTMARARNTGMEYNNDHTELLSTGSSPILIEPVNVIVTIQRKEKPVVTILDHVGRKTDKTIPVKNNTISFNGAVYRTMYYLIEYQH